MQTIFILYLAIGLINTLIAVPLIQEKIKPNPIYGFRVRATLENPRIWYAVNRYAGQRLLWAGIVLMIVAAMLYFVPNISLDTYAFACLAAFMIPFTIAMVQSFRYLRSLINETPE